ncbi:hypothetical protein TNCT_726641 [Trichonephila clavata]|uniref:Uncharacterized protein n=1 Tax=Trichonephila clavata TaxID=2740835 RepID=A0A8X6GYL6_TRICU|nr:hypothetical protein TNCT_726641 [Trichonephila clavata]
MVLYRMTLFLIALPTVLRTRYQGLPRVRSLTFADISRNIEQLVGQLILRVSAEKEKRTEEVEKQYKYVLGLALLLIFSLHIIFNFTCDEVLWQTRTEWNEVESDGFFTTGMTTQQTAPWENWHLERGFKLLRTFGLVRWGLGGSGHVEGTGKKLSFASQAAGAA